MALVVEDGTGKADAESYATVAQFTSYCEARGYATGGPDDEVVEQKLRLATDYIDAHYRFKGARKLSTQALEFPRTGLLDWSSYEITGVPSRLRSATIELAFKGLTDAAFFVDSDKSGRVTSEKVGPISITYGGDGADPSEKRYTVVDSMLAQYTRESAFEDLGGPVLGGTVSTTDPVFSIGMHDSKGLGPYEQT